MLYFHFLPLDYCRRPPPSSSTPVTIFLWRCNYPLLNLACSGGSTDAPTIGDWNTPIVGIVTLLRMGTDGQRDRDASVEFTFSSRAKSRSGLKWMLSIRS
ncbi:hypothetical protein M404DRAFT_34793 [Pisolithus tinctorius Marx 270]|uniref:Uncharacterized protein n=1 Tax=Pisolithus tinctorius Marx 270 TaxID=870435 RepID=A0A0C3N0Q2_PISTI|nr:hypothetical protein M404DRAFT_34793 [Pisolithus tinctorius Marx 270]